MTRTIVVAALLLSVSSASAQVVTPQSRVQYLMALVRCIDTFKDAQKRELVLCAQQLAKNPKGAPLLPEHKPPVPAPHE